MFRPNNIDTIQSIVIMKRIKNIIHCKWKVFGNVEQQKPGQIYCQMVAE